jgi:hypothetical protein
LAYRFQEMWKSEVLKQAPSLKQYRCVNMGAAIGYIRSQFLAQDYSPEHVEAYFEAYFAEILVSDLKLKEGQSAWQLFTGWWGSTPVPDPKIERERREEYERALAWLSERQAQDARREREAWLRIEAAQERGEQPADEDLIIAIGFAPQRRKVSAAS